MSILFGSRWSGLLTRLKETLCVYARWRQVYQWGGHGIHLWHYDKWCHLFSSLVHQIEWLVVQERVKISVKVETLEPNLMLCTILVLALPYHLRTFQSQQKYVVRVSSFPLIIAKPLLRLLLEVQSTKRRKYSNLEQILRIKTYCFS